MVIHFFFYIFVQAFFVCLLFMAINLCKCPSLYLCTCFSLELNKITDGKPIKLIWKIDIEATINQFKNLGFILKFLSSASSSSGGMCIAFVYVAAPASGGRYRAILLHNRDEVGRFAVLLLCACVCVLWLWWFLFQSTRKSYSSTVCVSAVQGHLLPLG